MQLWAPPRTPFHQELWRRCELEHASREVCAPVPAVAIPVWQGVASLWWPREEKLLLALNKHPSSLNWHPSSCFKSPLTWAVCLGHSLRVVGQERVLQQWTKLQGLWHNSHKAVPASSSWKWTCMTPFTASPQQPSKIKVIKADSWGIPIENNTEYVGVSPGTPYSFLPWTFP